MKFKEFKQLNYHPDDTMEFILSDMLFRHQIDVNTILLAYTGALEKERHIGYCKFEEACSNLTQLLSPAFAIVNPTYKKKDYKVDAVKRAIHTLNFSKTLPKDVRNSEYGYTEEDKKKWDEFCELHYTDEFKDW